MDLDAVFVPGHVVSSNLNKISFSRWYSKDTLKQKSDGMKMCVRKRGGNIEQNEASRSSIASLQGQGEFEKYHIWKVHSEDIGTSVNATQKSVAHNFSENMHLPNLTLISVLSEPGTCEFFRIFQTFKTSKS